MTLMIWMGPVNSERGSSGEELCVTMEPELPAKVSTRRRWGQSEAAVWSQETSFGIRI